ncbi:MAG: cupin domain-containing protein [Lachnospiraceae bacterium]|nr:cupin domain-containing protein [Lachnospiraceae bacterium]
MNHVFTIEQMRPIRDGMTISRDAGLGSENTITFFSLGKGTSISQERYDMTSVYIGAEGNADFVIGEEKNKLKLSSGDVIIVPGKTLCGVECDTGAVYTEIIIKKEIIMNNILKTGEVFKLKDLIQYEEGSISNLDIVRNDTMKFVLMAFDEGTGLQPHRAPGNAIVFALEGQAVINCEGKDYNISAGENFRFEKDGLHSVTANGKFKMALLLVIE